MLVTKFEVCGQWPFLLSWKFLLSHFTTLTGVELYTRLNEDLDKKGKRLLEFFRGQLMKWSKDIKAVLKEALNEGREGTDGLAAMVVMMAHFKEADDALFLLADVGLYIYLPCNQIVFCIHNCIVLHSNQGP